MQRGLSEGRQAETGAGRDARCGLTTQQVSGWFGDFQVTRPEGGAPWYQATDAGSSRGQLKYTNSGRDVKTEKLNVCERRGSEICYAVCLWRDALCRVVGALCVAHPLDAFDALTSLGKNLCTNLSDPRRRKTLLGSQISWVTWEMKKHKLTTGFQCIWCSGGAEEAFRTQTTSIVTLKSSQRYY